MDYKRVLKLHFVNGFSGRSSASSTVEGKRTAISEFFKRFKECEEMSWCQSVHWNDYSHGVEARQKGWEHSRNDIVYADWCKCGSL